MGKECSTDFKKSNACRSVVGTPEGKKPLRRGVSGRITLRWILES
jgi:hypothetical protein